MNRDPKTGKFLPGNSAGGRKKGSKTRADLTKAFITDVANDWQEHGREVLERLRDEQPHVYARVVAQVIPRDDSLLVEHTGAVETHTVNVQFKDAEDKPQVDQGVSTIEGEVVQAGATKH